MTCQRTLKQSLQKFVKEYVFTMQEGHKVLSKDRRLNSNFEENVLDLRPEAPFFNYVLVKTNRKGDLIEVGLIAQRRT